MLVVEANHWARLANLQSQHQHQPSLRWDCPPQTPMQTLTQMQEQDQDQAWEDVAEEAQPDLDLGRDFLPKVAVVQGQRTGQRKGEAMQKLRVRMRLMRAKRTQTQLMGSQSQSQLWRRRLRPRPQLQ